MQRRARASQRSEVNAIRLMPKETFKLFSTFNWWARCRRCGSAQPEGSSFSDELRLELHPAEAFDPAVDIVVASNQADALHLGARLEC